MGEAVSKEGGEVLGRVPSPSYSVNRQELAMRSLHLNRFCIGPQGTFGVLDVKDNGPDGDKEDVVFRCYTIERPWANNRPMLSCIPTGRYGLKLGRYNRGGYPAYVLQDVPHRTYIKIHKANTKKDVVGCIGLGKDLGYVDNQWAVTNSRMAYEHFMETMDGQQISEIGIVSCPFDLHAEPWS